MKAVTAVAQKIKNSLKDYLQMRKLGRLLRRAYDPTVSPQTLFGSVTDDYWFWLNTEGRRQSAALQKFLPGLPDETMQANFVGSAGDAALAEGFAVYQLFKRLFEEHVGPLVGCGNVMDFGCGWGRIIRFFLRDLGPAKLWGIDCYPEAIQVCKETNRWCRFELINPEPPTSFPDGSFDLIYCYSVFSHLAEDIHRRWLTEFHRVLRPGGLLIATTEPREFIEWAAALRNDPNLQEMSVWQQVVATIFVDTAQCLADYDAGKYCHQSTGGGGPLDGSFYGETCIPKGYVLSEWAKRFTPLDFIDDRGLCPQNVIVVKK